MILSQVLQDNRPNNLCENSKPQEPGLSWYQKVTTVQMMKESLSAIYLLSTWQFFFNYSLRLCSHKIKRHLLLGRKPMTYLDSILKSRDITLLTKVHIVKLWLFQESCMDVSWTIKKVEHWRIDAFELWCWRRLLRVPWTAKRSNQRRSVLNSRWKD